MQKQIHLVLGQRDVFQLLDGLEIREEAWRSTALFLETGESPADFFLAEECSKPEAGLYRWTNPSHFYGQTSLPHFLSRLISKRL